MATLANVEHRNQEATCYVGNLDPSVTEDLLVELFTQIGRVNSVHMPKDKVTGLHSGKFFVCVFVMAARVTFGATCSLGLL
jgi:splicing factor 3B subunit 4